MIEPNEIQTFLDRLQAHVTADYRGNGGDPEAIGPILSIEAGRKYARIVSAHHAQRSAFGFLDLTNGNLLKSDGWKKPALNFPRGHMADATFERVRWTGVN